MKEARGQRLIWCILPFSRLLNLHSGHVCLELVLMALSSLSRSQVHYVPFGTVFHYHRSPLSLLPKRSLDTKESHDSILPGPDKRRICLLFRPLQDHLHRMGRTLELAETCLHPRARTRAIGRCPQYRKREGRLRHHPYRAPRRFMPADPVYRGRPELRA